MLTQLRLKNWRSLRDVTIDDLQPINVFIGANSSGKTNIIDALRFRQYGAMKGNRGFLGAVRQWGGSQKIKTLGQQDTQVTIELSYEPLKNRPIITDRITLDFREKSDRKFHYSTLIMEGHNRIHFEETDLPVESQRGEKAIWPDAPESQLRLRGMAIQQYTHDYITKRWQILKEGFIPRLSLSSDESVGDVYLLESDGRNLPTVLSEMRVTRPEIYLKLQEDLAWLLTHIETVYAIEDEKETRIAIREHTNNQEAPSISAGTGRLVAMLAAYYALDMDLEALESPYGRMFEFDMERVLMPGMVIIEEPDMALNPGLLKNFVELLRGYIDRDEPRQFILTTHNPAFLNYFQPEEVRVVSRGDDGYTRVDRVPEQISEIWLDEYGLGEVWTTNSFGGIAR